MRVLLTGSSGNLGRCLGRLLSQRGHTVRTVLHASAIRRGSLPDDFEVVWGDLTRPSTVDEAVQQVDAVVHSAWIWPHQAAGDDLVNRRLVQQLWETSVERGVSRFVFLSSVAVYGMSRKERDPLDEESSYAQGAEADFDYPRQKIDVEEYLLRRQTLEGPRRCILRPGIFFDERRGPSKTFAVGGLRFGLGIGSGRNRMPLIHIADVADAVLRWLEAGEDDAIYNVTPTDSLSSRQWVRAWSRVNDVEARQIYVPKFVMGTAALGVTLLKRALGKKASTKGAKYALAAATRDIVYSNDALKRDLGWSDAATARYYVDGS